MSYYGSDEEEERSEEYNEEEMNWCSTCSRDLDAKVFCVDCLLSLCVPCREAHDIIPVTKGHQIIPVEQGLAAKRKRLSNIQASPTIGKDGRRTISTWGSQDPHPMSITSPNISIQDKMKSIEIISSGNGEINAIGLYTDLLKKECLVTVSEGAINIYNSSREVMYKIDEDSVGDLAYAQGLGVLPSRNLVVFDEGNANLQLYMLDGRHKETLAVDFSKSISQVVALGNGKCAVSSREDKTVYIINDVETSLDIEMKICGDVGDGLHLKDPWYISKWLSDGLIISDKGTKSVIGLINGELKWRWNNFTCPSSLCADQKGNILVTDLQTESYIIVMLSMSQLGVVLTRLQPENCSLPMAPQVMAISEEKQGRLLVGQIDGAVVGYDYLKETAGKSSTVDADTKETFTKGTKRKRGKVKTSKGKRK